MTNFYCIPFRKSNLHLYGFPFPVYYRLMSPSKQDSILWVILSLVPCPVLLSAPFTVDPT